MISVAPTLSFSALAGILAFGTTPADDQRLARSWNPDNQPVIWYSRATWGLEAIARWRRAQLSAVSPHIWIPDYFCNEPLGQLRDLGASIVFYPIDEAMEPDWAACNDLAQSVPPGLFVLVHYFGRVANGAAAKEFCNYHRALLIEDATHVLQPGNGVGASGDFAIYSPYKHLAIPDGGILIVADHAIADQLRAAVPQHEPATLAAYKWILRKIVRMIVPARLLHSVLRVGQAHFHDDPAPRTAMPGALSWIARRMIPRSEPSLPLIAERRRAAWKALWSITWPDGLRPFFGEGDAGPAPYRFVLDCRDSATAARFFDHLLAAGCPAESWPDLPPEVLDDPRRHPRPADLRYRLIFLPVHQTIDIPELVAACRVACRRYVASPAVHS